MDCCQVWGGAFTPKSPFEVTKTGVTKLAFIYVKKAKAKNNIISYIGVARVRNDQCLSEALPLTATRKGVIQKWATHVQRTFVEMGNIHFVFRRRRSTMDPVFVLK